MINDFPIRDEPNLCDAPQLDGKFRISPPALQGWLQGLSCEVWSFFFYLNPLTLQFRYLHVLQDAPSKQKFDANSDGDDNNDEEEDDKETFWDKDDAPYARLNTGVTSSDTFDASE